MFCLLKKDNDDKQKVVKCLQKRIALMLLPGVASE